MSISVKVSDPVRQTEGLISSGFVSYSLTTTTDFTSFTNSAPSVVRRYSDFVWLREELLRTHPGAVVPPLPEKAVVGRFSEEFVEARRRALERFCARICRHPDLRSSESFRIFLEGTNDEFNAVKSISAANEGRVSWFDPVSWTATFQSIQDAMRSNAQSITDAATFGGATSRLNPTNVENGAEEDPDADERDDGEAARMESEKEGAYRSAASFVDDFESRIDALYASSKAAIKKDKEAADALANLGVAFAELGAVDERRKTKSSKLLSRNLGLLGKAVERVSALEAEETKKEVVLLSEPLLEYVKLTKAVRSAMSVRGAQALAAQKAAARLEAHKKSHAELSSDGPEKDKSEVELQRLELVAAAAKDKRIEVEERFLREVERFKKDKQGDFKRVVLDFAKSNAEKAASVEKEWNELLEALAGK